jgi:hypothetical protein
VSRRDARPPAAHSARADDLRVTAGGARLGAVRSGRGGRRGHEPDRRRPPRRRAVRAAPRPARRPNLHRRAGGARAATTHGWLYLVTLAGTTGARDDLSPALAGLVARARAATDLPLYAGFGISTPEHARAAAALADGIVVGSRAVEVAQDGPAALREYVAGLRAALDDA